MGCEAGVAVPRRSSQWARHSIRYHAGPRIFSPGDGDPPAHAGPAHSETNAVAPGAAPGDGGEVGPTVGNPGYDPCVVNDPSEPPASSQPPSADGPRRRRPRYRGKHPRHFAEKYKEHDPERYAADVAKVLAAGKTPAGSHRPILVAEILDVLDPKPGELFVDCTLGYGGHAQKLLERLVPGGRLLGLDADDIEIQKTRARLAAAGWQEPTFAALRTNFAGLAQVLADAKAGGVDGLLADLGISSMQLDDPERGFTFKADGPLDLRLNSSRPPTAAQWLQRVTVRELERALREHADEPEAPLLAKELCRWRANGPLLRTGQLAEALRAILARWRPSMNAEAVVDTQRRCFQALRIAVNDEFGVLERLLAALPACLNPGGRVAILSFHSGEDRRVKQALRAGFNAGLYSAISDEVTRPGPEERRNNPRSKSAKLRWARRSEQPL